MTDEKRTKLSPQDKAQRTTQAANSIMDEERKASDAKVARLKALRLASQPSVSAADTARSPTARKPKAAKRSLALQGDFVGSRK